MVTPVRHDLSDPAIPEGMVRISAGAEHRFIWPVHLGGWQSLGWQLQEAAADLPNAPTPGADLPDAPIGATPEELLPGVIPTDLIALEPEEVAQPLPAVEPAAVPEADWEPEPEPAAEPKPDAAPAPVAAPDYQAMTKAQILEHCSSVYCVELDGSQTKAELVEQATALAQQPEQPLPDLLLDDPLI
ncbi:hypothetical protein KBY83_02590 [Cyanobium sp. WKJ7-Wakatipu]|uniref:hypothetical protein n=1 Tax=Cyanobium sp. WKJ7-Wakatipu TaxID=2823726 RepID=UPI0020CCF34C|nr:hypothetical protein [Cyanobium sp. WKJ7-Wakatipu]MCP9782209.1 hypothetical protein [Cyanobium sp. WKJ7-Wakatipu]